MRFFRKFIVVSVTLSLATSCSTVAVPVTDGMCSRIADFANATKDDSKHTVELRNTDSFGQTCDANSYEPGATLCNWLTSHTSREFAEDNISNALSCIGAKRLYFGGGLPGEQLNVEYYTGKINSTDLKLVRQGIMVEVEYSIGVENHPTYLKISAEQQ